MGSRPRMVEILSEDGKEQRSVGARIGIAAAILSASILLSRILGFMREAVIAYFYGASSATDAYYAAFTLPDLMAYFLAGGTLSITFIPLFSSFVAKGDEEGGWRLFSIVATTMGSALLAFTILFMIFAPELVPLVFPGFEDPEQLQLAVDMTRIVLPAQMAFYFGGLIAATLFVREVFWPSALAPLVYNICIITGGIVLASFMGIRGFAVGVLVGAFLGPLGLPLFAARKQIKFRPKFSPTDPGFVQFFMLTLPLMLGVSLVTVDEWLLKYFGSMHQEGAITWLNNGRKLTLMAFAIIGQAAGQAALPYLTRLYHEDKHDEMGRMLGISLQRVVFLASVAACGLVAIAAPVVYLIFRRGQFTAEDAALTAQMLTIFAIGLPAWATQAMIARGFYARKDTFSPMIIGSVVVAVSAPVYFLLNEKYGVVGLPVATSVGITLNACTLLTVYKLRYKQLELMMPLSGLLRGLAFGAACGIPAYLAGHHIYDASSQWIATGALAAIFGIFGAIAAVIILIKTPPELEFVLNKLKRRLNKRRGEAEA